MGRELLPLIRRRPTFICVPPTTASGPCSSPTRSVAHRRWRVRRRILPSGPCSRSTACAFTANAVVGWRRSCTGRCWFSVGLAAIGGSTTSRTALRPRCSIRPVYGPLRRRSRWVGPTSPGRATTAAISSGPVSEVDLNRSRGPPIFASDDHGPVPRSRSVACAAVQAAAPTAGRRPRSRRDDAGSATRPDLGSPVSTGRSDYRASSPDDYETNTGPGGIRSAGTMHHRMAREMSFNRTPVVKRSRRAAGKVRRRVITAPFLRTMGQRFYGAPDALAGADGPLPSGLLTPDQLGMLRLDYVVSADLSGALPAAVVEGATGFCDRLRRRHRSAGPRSPCPSSTYSTSSTCGHGA